MYTLPSICLECNLVHELQLFKSLTAQSNEIFAPFVDDNALKALQSIVDGSNSAESPSCDLECKKKAIYVYGILGVDKLISHVPSSLRDLLSQFKTFDTIALNHLNQVSPTDEAGQAEIFCKLFRSKNQLLRKISSSSN